MEQWIETRKGGDFAGIGERFRIDPVVARIIRNRDLVTEEEIHTYLNGDITMLSSPFAMKDMELAVELVSEKLAQGKAIRIIGDYDIDGVHATYILYKVLCDLGGNADYAIPHRITDGYGINRHLIERASADGVDTIVTCDNGIAAIEEIAYAKELGMTVVVTDHHEIPFEKPGNERIYKKSCADAILNPKQPDCPYPYKELCGAAVVFQFVRALYERWGRPKEAAFAFLENAAFATVGDVMNLTGENRILVKAGLKALQNTKNLGMQSLILKNNLDPEQISSYHIGFVLGPCFNASGRLDTAEDAIKLLLAETESEASKLAGRLVDLNQSRKALTAEQLEKAFEKIETEHMEEDRVLVVYLPECHESLAGIIAGRIRERYYRPVFVLTRGEDGIKGSGRSIEEYSMYEEMNKVSELFTKFGGHPMAAGLSMEETQIQEFRRRINEVCTLSENDLTEKVRIDVAMPIGYVHEELIEQIHILEPFGKGNPKPVFADRKIHIRSARVLGTNRNVVKMEIAGGDCYSRKAVYFGDGEKFLADMRERFGEAEVDAMLIGRTNAIEISIVYDMAIDTYRGANDPQVVIRRYR